MDALLLSIRSEEQFLVVSRTLGPTACLRIYRLINFFASIIFSWIKNLLIFLHLMCFKHCINILLPLRLCISFVFHWGTLKIIRVFRLCSVSVKAMCFALSQKAVKLSSFGVILSSMHTTSHQTLIYKGFLMTTKLWWHFTTLYEALLAITYTLQLVINNQTQQWVCPHK